MLTVQKQQSGFSLLELLLVLVVIAVLLVTTVRFYLIARSNAQVTQTLAQIDTLVDASYKWVEGQQGNFCGPSSSDNCTNPVSIDALINAGFITKSDTYNAFDGVTPVVLSFWDQDKSKLKISISPIPQGPCQSLVAKLTGRAYHVSCDAAHDGFYLNAVF